MKENIFDWKDYNSWNITFDIFVRELLPKNFDSLIHKNKEEIYCDSAGDLEYYVRDENDNYFFNSEFRTFIKSNYSHILTYHGCRPLNTESYYEKGLLKLNVSHQNDNFVNLFLNENFNEVLKEDIDYAINETNKERRENQLFLGLDDRELIEMSGHYLIYGSEYIVCLATRLSDRLKRDYQAFLRNHGEPTIFKVKLPIPDIKDDDLVALFPILYRVWIYNTLNERNIACSVDFSFFLKININPELIMSHYHPTKIRDWLNKGSIYISETNSYIFDDLSAV